MTAFVVLGAIAVIVGVVLLATAIRHQKERQPKYAAMLIGAMMLTAFGLVIGGFAIAYNSAEPLDLNSTQEVR